MARKCARTFSIVVEKGKKSILDVGHLLPDALPRSVRALAAKNMADTRGKLLAATQAEKPHASGRWGAGIRILGLATGLRMPGCVSPSLAARASFL